LNTPELGSVGRIDGVLGQVVTRQIPIPSVPVSQ
jgi:hypothetical protein